MSRNSWTTVPPRLAGFKVPARIETVGALPRTALNKVLRGRLRQELARSKGSRA